jgi:hypothetical protein
MKIQWRVIIQNLISLRYMIKGTHYPLNDITLEPYYLYRGYQDSLAQYMIEIYTQSQSFCFLNSSYFRIILY